MTDGEIEVGMTFHSHESDNGGRVVRVVEVSPEQVTIDGNHPLAGVTLNFSVRIQDVREASAEELDHGHVHGPGTHHH